MADDNPVIGTFIVYNLFQNDPEPRLHKSADGFESRLEKIIFYKLADGSFEVMLQEGWFAGSHYDGCGNIFDIPKTFFVPTWPGFLENLYQKYSTISDYYSMSELENNQELRAFFGY